MRARSSRLVSRAASAAALTLAAFAFAACGGTGSSGGGGGGGGGAEGGAALGPSASGSDQAGDFPDGTVGDEQLVQISKIDRKGMHETGTVTYYVDNVSGERLRDLTYWVQFQWPPNNPQVPYDSDVTDQKSLVLVKGAAGEALTATSPEFAQRTSGDKPQKIQATRLIMMQERPVAAVSREEAGQGTLFVQGALECVAISPEDLLWESPGQLWIDFENVSDRSLSRLQVQVVFVDISEDVTGETKNERLATLKPGAKKRVTFDLSEAGTVRGREMRVRVTQRSGFGGGR